jgi:hypothetical protein
MSKLAHVVEETGNDVAKNVSGENDLLFLKKQKEDEIRMKLDQFARELSQVKKQRDQH